jgi:hypothetical protein
MQVLLEITLSDWTPTNPNPFYKSLKLLFERGKDRDDAKYCCIYGFSSNILFCFVSQDFNNFITNGFLLCLIFVA